MLVIYRAPKQRRAVDACYRRGDTEEAERIAREGAAIAARTDWLYLQADALMDLADVLRLMGRVGEARRNIQIAAELFEQRGNSVMASRARAFGEQLSATPSG